MTLTELRYVVALARERHFGRAAERCFVSQPTLSVAVRKLEEELGVALFERHRGEVSPTPVGGRIVEQAEKVLSEAQTVEDIARAGRDELEGPLRLGAIYTVGPYLLPHLIPELHRRAPHMPLIIEENYTAQLERHLQHNEVDVVIVAAPFEQPGVATLPLYEEPFVVVLPRDHPWTRRRRIATRDLAGERLLLLGPGHCFRDQVLEACPDCRDSQADGQQPLAGSSLETIRHMVASGLGITVLPQSALGTSNTDGGLLVERPFAAPAPSRQILLAWRRSFPRPQAISVLRDAILSCSLDGVSRPEPVATQ